MQPTRLIARLRRFALACVTAGLAATAAAQAPFPSKPIRILVGVGAGGSVDAIARMYGQHLSTVLKTPVIVENRVSGFQIAAIRGLMTAPPDGHTLFMTNGSAVALAPATKKDLPYDPEKDFTYVAQVGTWTSVIMVNNDLPVRNLDELVAYSKANPSAVNYASAGLGTGSHLKIEYLKTVSGLKATHIPYKSDADVMREMMAGTVQMGITTSLGAMPSVSAGKVKAIAVTAPASLPYLPNVPSTSQSAIKGLEKLEPYSFVGFLGPVGMPQAVVDKLNEAINKVSEMPEVKARMRDVLFTDITIGTPAAFRAFSARELANAREVAKLLPATE